jgi:hypothetical protein
MGKNKVGRPTVMTDDVIQKLKFGFMKGLTDDECCDFAEICTSTLYNYCNQNPEFMEQKERWKHRPSTKAKINIVEAVENGDVELSKWSLERPNKAEFSPKVEIEADVDAEVNINIELSDD